MKFAVIADIHGNSFALKAVLNDIEALGISQAINLGDMFSGPIDPAGTAALLMERDFITIRGNHDRYLIEHQPPDMGPSDRVAFDQLTEQTLNWIKGLPMTRHVLDDVSLCHGTPRSDTTYWLDRVDQDGTVRAARLAEVLQEADGVDASLILCAHTHIPRCVSLPDGRVVVNPGSVGCPAYDDDMPVYHHMQTGTPNASYAVMEQRDNTWITTMRSIPYDHGKASDCAMAHNRPDWARALNTGWFEAE